MFAVVLAVSFPLLLLVLLMAAESLERGLGEPFPSEPSWLAGPLEQAGTTGNGVAVPRHEASDPLVAGSAVERARRDRTVPEGTVLVGSVSTSLSNRGSRLAPVDHGVIPDLRPQ